LPQRPVWRPVPHGRIPAARSCVLGPPRCASALRAVRCGPRAGRRGGRPGRAAMGAGVARPLPDGTGGVV